MVDFRVHALYYYALTVYAQIFHDRDLEFKYSLPSLLIKLRNYWIIEIEVILRGAVSSAFISPDNLTRGRIKPGRRGCLTKCINRLQPHFTILCDMRNNAFLEGLLWRLEKFYIYFSGTEWSTLETIAIIKLSLLFHLQMRKSRIREYKGFP